MLHYILLYYKAFLKYFFSSIIVPVDADQRNIIYNIISYCIIYDYFYVVRVPCNTVERREILSFFLFGE